MQGGTDLSEHDILIDYVLKLLQLRNLGNLDELFSRQRGGNVFCLFLNGPNCVPFVKPTLLQ